MAIVKMKKLQVIAPAAVRDDLLRELQRLGCVEVRAAEEQLADSALAALLRPEHGDAQSARAERQLYAEALAVLDRYAPVKTPMLAPKPALEKARLLDGEDDAEAAQSARSLAALEEEMRGLASAETRERLRLEALQPWKSCPLPLDCAGTAHAAVLFGMFPARTDMDALSAALSEQTAQLFEAGADEAARYAYVLCLRAETEEVTKCLREFGFAAPAYGEQHGTAAENIAAAEAALADVNAKQKETFEKITALAPARDALRVAYDRAGLKVERAEAADKLLGTEKTVFLTGWAVADREAEVAALLGSRDCAYDFADPVEEEYPEVPVKLRNNRLTDGLNMVTNMYSLPQYGSVDPNPLMAPFFILFYGIMMADIGYGAVMILIGALILWKKKPEEGFMRYFAELMVEGGIVTAIMGALSGGCFGDAPYRIVHLLNPASTWEGLPKLFDPLNDTIQVLIGSLILGFVHLNTGLAVSFHLKRKRGHLADALWEEGVMWLLFIGIASAVLDFGSIGGVPVLFYATLLLYVIAKMRGGKGVVGKIMGVFSGIYNDATGWFGDILSYSRLMALMLAGSVIAQVFNTLGALPGSIIVFIPIFLFGNALNFGLNLLGCYVHDLRLQCLEFFGKFYEDGGKPFKPLAARSKYYSVNK